VDVVRADRRTGYVCGGLCSEHSDAEAQGEGFSHGALILTLLAPASDMAQAQAAAKTMARSEAAPDFTQVSMLINDAIAQEKLPGA